MLQVRANNMKKYIDSVLLALREDSNIIVGERIDKVNDFFFIDVALKTGGPSEELLLDFDKENLLTIVARFGEPFSTDTSHVNALAYIALSRANDALLEKKKPGKCLLNLDIGKARFMYAACLPLLSEPKEAAAFIKQVLAGIWEVRDFLCCFTQQANEDTLSVDDALELEPLKEGQMRVTLHPALAILSDEDINVNEDQEEE